jgi:hypothetical protein
LRIYVDLDNTLLDSASRLVDYKPTYEPEKQLSYELKKDLLKHFSNPQFYQFGEIKINEEVERYLEGLVGSHTEDICFISLSPTKEIAEKKKKLLAQLGYGESSLISFYSLKQEEKMLGRLVQSAKDSSEPTVFIDDNPYRILKYQDNQAEYRVVRHPYTVGRYPSHVYVASANYYN